MAKKEKGWTVYHAGSTMWVKDYAVKSAAEKYAAKMGAGYAVTDAVTYAFKVVHMVEKTNMMSGGKYMEASNTPGYMSPASEAYWSM